MTLPQYACKYKQKKSRFLPQREREKDTEKERGNRGRHYDCVSGQERKGMYVEPIPSFQQEHKGRSSSLPAFCDFVQSYRLILQKKKNPTQSRRFPFEFGKLEIDCVLGIYG
jgi:hypothetical protein